MKNLTELPVDLPVPVDDGLCNHLSGTKLPNISLLSTSGEHINFKSIRDVLILYFYPMTGRPDINLPSGWDSIPGARGCTPQACSYRDHYEDIKSLGATVYGISTQSTAYQIEVATRLNLPFDLLSDENNKLIDLMKLPTFSIEGKKLIKRLTLICRDNTIEHVIYPVFPPNKDAPKVINLLKILKNH